MQENVSDLYAFAAVLVLPLVAWVVSRPPVWLRIRTRLEPVALRLWQQVIEPEPLDEVILHRWATVRLEQLRGHLDRVRRLILDDEWMTATRQTANRMAYEHLVRDVRDAEVTVSAFGPVELWQVPAAPTPLSTARFSYAAPAQRTAVEVIEFGPRGRWI